MEIDDSKNDFGKVLEKYAIAQSPMWRNVLWYLSRGTPVK